MRSDFFDLMFELMDGHIPLLQALTIASVELKGGGIDKACIAIRDHVKEGGEFNVKMNEFSELFPPPIPTFVETAEQTAMLEDLFKMLAEGARSGGLEASSTDIRIAQRRWFYQLWIATRIGCSLYKAFEELGRCEPHETLRDISVRIHEELKAGNALGIVMEDYPDVFVFSTVALVKHAEMAGDLSRTFHQLQAGMGRGLFLPS